MHQKNRHKSSSSDNEIKSKIKEFGYDLKQAQKRADTLLSELNSTKFNSSSHHQYNYTRSYSPPKIFNPSYNPIIQITYCASYIKLRYQDNYFLSIARPQQTQIQQQQYIPAAPVAQANAPLRESYFEYIPKEHTIIEYTPVQKIEYIPQERKVIDYEVVEHIIEKQPVKRYEKKIEYVPVERLEERVEYQISERTQLHQSINSSGSLQNAAQQQQQSYPYQTQVIQPTYNSVQLPGKQGFSSYNSVQLPGKQGFSPTQNSIIGVQQQQQRQQYIQQLQPSNTIYSNYYSNPTAQQITAAPIYQSNSIQTHPHAIQSSQFPGSSKIQLIHKNK